MIEMDEKYFKINQQGQDAALFFISPFCATCQLAEEMLNVAIEAAQPPFPIYKCRASEWLNTVENLRIRSVPCLVLIENGGLKDIVYAFESVTNIYAKLHYST